MSGPQPSATDPGCWWHGVEPVPADCFRVCVECGHAFTAQELLDSHNAHVALSEEIDRRARMRQSAWDGQGNWIDPAPPTVPDWPITDPELVRICPLCTHDF